MDINKEARKQFLLAGLFNLSILHTDGIDRIVSAELVDRVEHGDKHDQKHADYGNRNRSKGEHIAIVGDIGPNHLDTIVDGKAQGKAPQQRLSISRVCFLLQIRHNRFSIYKTKKPEIFRFQDIGSKCPPDT